MHKDYSIRTHHKAAHSGLAYLSQRKPLGEGPGISVHLAGCFIKVARSRLCLQPE